MLVKPRNERGSTLISVLMVMLVLTIIAMALAAVVMNTTRIMADSRTTAQSRAAADAGLAAVLAAFNANGSNCPTSAVKSTTDPKYTTTCAATSSQVTFTSTGTAGTASDQIQAVYELVSSGGGASFTFFTGAGSVADFDSHIFIEPYETGSVLTVEFPAGGTFKCKTPLKGNVVMAGSIVMDNAGCDITGNAYIGGANVDQKDWALKVNGSGQTVGGTLIVNGPAHLGGLAAGAIKGSLVVPSGKTLESDKPQNIPGMALGGVQRPASAPAAPEMSKWFEYSRPTAWPGYDVVQITTTSSGLQCRDIASSEKWSGRVNFWNNTLPNLTTNTVFDATACPDGFNSGGGGNPDIEVGANAALIGRKFVLEALTIKPKSGKDPKLFMVVPDPTPGDKKPTCSGTAGDISTTSNVTITAKTMAYTPCKVHFGAGGEWVGAIFSGGYQGGGKLKLRGFPMSLPGQPGGGSGGGSGKTLGALVSQREVTP